MGFPHSEISGSQVAKHLPEAYRRYAASFIASFSLGIHRTPLPRTPIRSTENRVSLFVSTLPREIARSICHCAPRAKALGDRNTPRLCISWGSCIDPGKTRTRTNVYC